MVELPKKFAYRIAISQRSNHLTKLSTCLCMEHWLVQCAQLSVSSGNLVIWIGLVLEEHPQFWRCNFLDVFFFTSSASRNLTEKFQQNIVPDIVSPTILVVMSEYFLFWFLITFHRRGCVNVLLFWSMWKWQFNLFGYGYVYLHYIHALNTLSYDNKMNGMSEAVAGTITRANGKLDDDATKK